MKDLTGVPDEDKHKYLNWNIGPIGFKAGQQVKPSIFQLDVTKRATLFHRQGDHLGSVRAVKLSSWIDTPETMQQAVGDAAKKLAAAIEGVIRQAINTRLGRDDWQLDELTGRLEVQYPQNKPGVEVYHLDNLPLVAFYEVQFSGDAGSVKAHRRYELYN